MHKTTVQGPDFSRIKEEGHYEVILKDFTLDFYFRPSNTRTAYIFSPGWINREQHPYPYFQRVKWLADLDGLGISFADPTQRLADDLQIGWFLGTKTVDYAKTIAAYVQGLLRHFGIKPSSALFFGSSAGGFASLVMATHLRGAKALAVNPQTEILRFHDLSELSRTIRACFGNVSTIRLEEAFTARLSVASLWRQEKYIPPAIIMVNTHDHWHMEHHVTPLIGGLKNLDVSSALEMRFFSNAEAGHNPPPAHRLLPVMQELTDH